jgi:hypothetical protein
LEDSGLANRLARRACSGPRLSEVTSILQQLLDAVAFNIFSHQVRWRLSCLLSFSASNCFPKMRCSRLALALFAIVCQVAPVQSMNLDDMDMDDGMSCEDMGFDPEKVHCSGCDKLKQHIKDDKLVTECYDCCVEDRQRYGKAALFVCKDGLKQMEDLKNFIEKDAKDFPNLSVISSRVFYNSSLNTYLDTQVQYTAPQKYMGMSMCGQPALKMRDDSGKDQDTVEIANWKQDQLRDYLESKLIKD